jgi:hypothetical protein
MHRVLGLLALASAPACDAPKCGDATYFTAADALARWDTDGDGQYADLIERCGPLYGTFGLRRHDLGVTTLLPSPNVPSGDFSEDLETGTLLLPASTLTFYTEHLVEGNTIRVDQIGGTGLHKLHGTAAPDYSVYWLFEAEIRVLEGPKVVRGTVAESTGAERWRLAWKATFGDIANGWVLQTWEAEDVVEISDGTEIGDETAYPPDWTGPRPDPATEE